MLIKGKEFSNTLVSLAGGLILFFAGVTWFTFGPLTNGIPPAGPFLLIMLGVGGIGASGAFCFTEFASQARPSAFAVGADAVAFLQKVLEAMNCKWKRTKENDDEDRITFEYQGAAFITKVRPDNVCINLFYMDLYEAQPSDLNAVRYLCNDLNFRTTFPRFTYSSNPETNVIDIHLVTGFMLPGELSEAKVLLEGILSMNFRLKHRFVQEYEEKIKLFKDGDYDFELENTLDMREIFLLREQEFSSQQADWQWRLNETTRLRLGAFMDKRLDLKEIIPCRLRVITDTIETIEGEAAMQFDMTAPLRSRERLLLEFTYALPMSSSCEQTLFFDLKRQEEIDRAVYICLTGCCPPAVVDTSHTIESQLESFSLLIAYDKMSNDEKLAEANYMWLDARDKMEKGEEDELTEEQKMIYAQENPDVAYSLYWGRVYLGAKRYFEALLNLENAYFYLQNNYHKLKRAEKDRFLEIRYLIGFCYVELQQYERAFFYLDISIIGERLVTHTEELVNCLANAKDFRALLLINALDQNVRLQEMDENGEVDPAVNKFLQFLKRRKGFVFMNQGRLDEAERLFTALLDDPDSRDYALDELNRIKKLRRQNDDKTDK